MEILHSGWECPSNIALIKYWGKLPGQIPCNPSLSITLDRAHTQTRITATPQQSRFPNLHVQFNGEHAPTLETKLTGFIQSIVQEHPWILSYHLHIETENSFPHGAGIASSASGMGALGLGLCDLQRQLEGGLHDASFFQKASHLARLGSGSASRSVYGGYVTWGEIPEVTYSSNLYASPLETPVHQVFQRWQNDILIVDPAEKKVSSTAGHGLMKTNPFSQNRFAQAYTHIQELIQAISHGNVEKFITLVEAEALTLHAMMMTSQPNYLLMRPGSVLAIEKIRDFRQQTGTPVCFTLDAGPNVHILYPMAVKDRVQPFIQEELMSALPGARLLSDHLGTGPRYLGNA
jgi:diphosphomevalonate decarboxylase